MSNLTENYDIKDLYIVKFNEKYLNLLGNSNKFINYFNSNLYYIVERFRYEKNELFIHEIYRECIIGEDFYFRESKRDVLSIPNIFSSIEEFPLDYLDEEEKKEEQVSSARLFQIFQEINYKKVKKIGKR